jgi:hypothetical protein
MGLFGNCSSLVCALDFSLLFFNRCALDLRSLYFLESGWYYIVFHTISMGRIYIYIYMLDWNCDICHVNCHVTVHILVISVVTVTSIYKKLVINIIIPLIADNDSNYFN